MDYQPVLILADPKGGAWNFANSVCKVAESQQKRRFKIGEVSMKRFANGEILPHIEENVRNHECYFIHDSSITPQEWLVTLGLVNDALMRSSAREINDVLPFMPYQRQDRMTGPRSPISAGFVASVIQLHGNRVLTCDLHNPATAGAYRIPFDNLRAYLTIVNHLKKNYAEEIKEAVLVAPDVGSTKRVESYQKRLGLDGVVIEKIRDEETGKIKRMNVIGDIKGRNAIMVDDMIDTGGTNIVATAVLKEHGARKVYSCATHGIFSRNAEERIQESDLEKVIITDSIPQESNGKIDVITLADLFAEAIHRITHGDSISALFEQPDNK
jgi:ribose-phosphate pyrophosphokinase